MIKVAAHKNIVNVCFLFGYLRGWLSRKVPRQFRLQTINKRHELVLIRKLTKGTGEKLQVYGWNTLMVEHRLVFTTLDEYINHFAT